MHQKREFWGKWLEVVTDHNRADRISHYIAHGIPVGYQGLHTRVVSDNWPSAIEHSVDIEEFITKNLKLGVISGPLMDPPGT